MASYHCSVKVMSRSSGRSSVQFSAYMGGQSLHDERLGETFSHTSKEEVCYNEMIFADRVPEQIRDQEKFWNSVESAEKSANAQVSRTWEIALPHELTIEQNIELAHKYAQELVEKDGMPACQVAVHQKDGNWHCHIMAPTRDMDEKGKWLAKEKKEYALDSDGKRIPIIDPTTGEQKVDSRNRKQWERVTVERNNWNSKELLSEWRLRAATHQNRALERGGHEVRVDHRSLRDQGIERVPEIHEGYTARQMGEESERVRHNMEVREMNREIEKQRSLAEKLQAEFEKWKGEIAHVRDLVSERIRGIGERLAARQTEQTLGRNRDGVEYTADTSERLRDIRAKLDNQRAREEERGARVDQSGIERQGREFEQERLRAEEIARAEKRSRTIEHDFIR